MAEGDQSNMPRQGEDLVFATLFGRFQLRASDGSEVVISNRRVRAVLAMLCLEPNQPIERDYLSKLLNVPVSFAQMQALLLGDYLPAPTGTTPTVTSEEAGRQRVVYPLAGVLVERILQATGRVQQLKVSDDATKRNLTVDYTDFKPLEQQADITFAHATLIQAQQAAAGVVTAALNYTKVNVGRERLAFPFTVPKGYKRRK